jgi:hypothetical protein
MPLGMAWGWLTNNIRILQVMAILPARRYTVPKPEPDFSAATILLLPAMRKGAMLLTTLVI